MASKVIGVIGSKGWERYGSLFRALGQLYGLEFSEATGLSQDRLDGLLFLNGDVSAAAASAARGTPSFVFVGEAAERCASMARRVVFGKSPPVDRCLWNQEMTGLSDDAGQALNPRNEEEVLAYQEGNPVWLSRKVGPADCQIAAVPLPRLREGGFLFEHFNRHRFMGLLPVMHFLQRFAPESDWAGPQPRACFVFDDPSLYWRSYGFLDFRRLGEHAVRHNYCIAVATIPIDTWWVKGSVAEIFRGLNPRFSLMIHGNNHTSCELLAEANLEHSLEHCAQALRRMTRLENRYKLGFQRIMEPPHGAIAVEVFGHLLSLGYEAALCTTEELVRQNPHVSLPPTIGMEKFQTFGGGLPVIPRIMMSPNWKNDVLLAAYSRQPIVIAGHHGDAAQGLGILARVAETVNSLGIYSWSDIGTALRENYLHSVHGETQVVKMCSRRITFPVGPGIARLRVERPWLGMDSVEPLALSSDGFRSRLLDATRTANFELAGPGLFELSSEPANPRDLWEVNQPPVSCWPFCRKILMEVRDRVSPFLGAGFARNHCGD